MLHARSFSYRSLVAAGLLSLLGMLLAASPSYAVPEPPTNGKITIDFTATVTDVSDRQNQVPGVHVGDVITGKYSYNLATPDSNQLAEVGDYVYTGTSKNKLGFGISVNLGQFTAQTDPNNPNFLVEIIDNYQDLDNYLLRSYNNTSTGPTVEHISLQLDDPTQTALTSPALPTKPPVLSAWQQPFGFEVRGAGSRGFFIRANMTTVRNA
jgi:hypothetical protein